MIASIFREVIHIKMPLKTFNHMIAPDPYLHMEAGMRVIICDARFMRCANNK